MRYSAFTKICPVCNDQLLRRRGRRNWMQLIPGSRYYKCSACSSKFLVLMPAIGDALQRIKPVKVLIFLSIIIVLTYGVFLFKGIRVNKNLPSEQLDGTRVSNNVPDEQPAKHESNISQGDLQATFTWETVPYVTTYNIYWLEKSGVTKLNGNKISNVASPHTVKGLKKGNAYSFVVTAVEGLIESDESEEISFPASE